MGGGADLNGIQIGKEEIQQSFTDDMINGKNSKRIYKKQTKQKFETNQQL